jgi:hypothetical protein
MNNFKNVFDVVGTYDRDKPLFDKLGLKPFKVGCGKRFFVGKINPHKNCSIKIWCKGLPAQFWGFEVVDVEGRHHEISTGSGALTDYWPSVLLVAGACFVIKTHKQE